MGYESEEGRRPPERAIELRQKLTEPKERMTLEQTKSLISRLIQKTNCLSGRFRRHIEEEEEKKWNGRSRSALFQTIREMMRWRKTTGFSSISGIIWNYFSSQKFPNLYFSCNILDVLLFDIFRDNNAPLVLL